MDESNSIKEAVYGGLFESALTQMRLTHSEIINHHGGFESFDECVKWAKDNLCDIVAYSKAQKTYLYLTHQGILLTKGAWLDHYCDILYVNGENKKGEEKRIAWIPTGVKYLSSARLIAEVSDGQLQPLYHRDYFTPTGYYDTARGTFNSAKPFPVAARKTGRDTSHIYTFIEHIAGECAPWILTWLRTKMLWPTQKTQVVPVFVSRAQGTGKTTFAEVLCKGIFGKDNVLVTDQYDSQSRFNADYADALVVCHEEKEEVDRRNPAATIKSRATATTIRKENKGVDPIYQESYTEFIMTSNKDVPIKFDDREDQRRFMIMEADPNFTRKNSKLADEVFTKLYGRDADSLVSGIPFTEDRDLIAQFKHELYEDKALEKVQLRRFPQTAAYQKCFSLPRTSEVTEIEAILRSLVPFIKASLQDKKIVQNVLDPAISDQMMSMSNIINTPTALQYMPGVGTIQPHVALCRPLIFYDLQTGKPFNHAVVERGLFDCNPWLQEEFGLILLPNMQPLPGGFMNVAGRYRSAPAARIGLIEEIGSAPRSNLSTDIHIVKARLEPERREGLCLRINGKWQPDVKGEFETLNEMKVGVTDLTNKNENVAYMDTFLFEADETTKNIYRIEEARVQKYTTVSGIDAEVLFQERLRLQAAEAERLYVQGIARRVVYSGGKSYHIVVRIKDSPRSLEEYKWLHAHLCTILSDKLTFDTSTADPARLTRAPIFFERSFSYNGIPVFGKQRLIHENANNVFDYNWRVLYNQWRDRPLTEYEQNKGRKMVPHKPEYMEAMQALLYGTFWTDSEWNGRRQLCFFPGYRLCRVLGYSHDELWQEGGILDGIDRYYRKNEIQYWRSRESADIIQQIDADVDRQEEEIQNNA